MPSVGRRIRTFPKRTSLFSSAPLLLRLLSTAIRVSSLLTRIISQSYTSEHISNNNQEVVRWLSFPLFESAEFHRLKSAWASHSTVEKAGGFRVCVTTGGRTCRARTSSRRTKSATRPSSRSRTSSSQAAPSTCSIPFFFPARPERICHRGTKTLRKSGNLFSSRTQCSLHSLWLILAFEAQPRMDTDTHRY